MLVHRLRSDEPAIRRDCLRLCIVSQDRGDAERGFGLGRRDQLANLALEVLCLISDRFFAAVCLLGFRDLLGVR